MKTLTLVLALTTIASCALQKSKVAFPMEPETAKFVADSAKQPPTANLPLSQLREGYKSSVITNSVPADQSVRTEDRTLKTQASEISLRLYTPSEVAQKSGLLIYVHGGGFAVGDLASHDSLLRLIAKESNLKVLALDYHRAPENPYPAALNDVVQTYQWALVNAKTLGIDPQLIALGGESAGATHATAAALAIRDRKLGPLKALWIMSPALDALTTGESYRLFATGAGRTASEFTFLWSLYIPDPKQRGLPGPSPFYADVSRLPKVFIYTAEFDPARDDGEAFAKKIQDISGPVSLKRQTGLVHQFPEITGISKASRSAVVTAAKELGLFLH